MPTLPLNRVTRTDNIGSVFPDATALLTTSVSFNQGDLMYYDGSADIIKPLLSDADSQQFLGIAPVTVVSGKQQSPYQGTAVDAAQAITNIPGPVYGVVARMKAKTGDTFTRGDVVYHSSADDAQTVTSSAPSSGSVSIGVYEGPTVSSVASGTQVEVKLGHRYPGNTLVL